MVSYKRSRGLPSPRCDWKHQPLPLESSLKAKVNGGREAHALRGQFCDELGLEVLEAGHRAGSVGQQSKSEERLSVSQIGGDVAHGVGEAVTPRLSGYQHTFGALEFRKQACVPLRSGIFRVRNLGPHRAVVL